MSERSASAVRWCDQNGPRLTLMSPVCVFMKAALCFPHHDLRAPAFGFDGRRAYSLPPPSRVLCTLPLNKLWRGVRVYHMFCAPCLEPILLLVAFQTACSLTTLNTGLLFEWGGDGGVKGAGLSTMKGSCLSLYQAAVTDAPSL